MENFLEKEENWNVEMIRFLQGQLNKAEKVQFLAKLESNHSFAQLFQDYRDLWIASSLNKQEVLKSQNTKSWQAISAFMQKDENESGRRMLKMQIRSVYRYAAMILVIFGLGYLSSRLTSSEGQIIENPIQEVATLSGSKTRVNLPDGTVAWINAGSKIKYPSRFEGKNREIELSGEAYFEIKHDTVHPFVVKTAQYNVIAVGTVFDAFADKGFFQTTLVEGKVLIQRKGQDETITLKPKQSVSLDTINQKLEIRTVDPDYYTSWKDGKLKFDNEPLSHVILKLERWFNCEFIFNDINISKIPYTGTIEMESVSEIMDLMCITSPKPLRYTFNKDKRIVEIFRK
jgi:transmembrane sensor